MSRLSAHGFISCRTVPYLNTLSRLHILIHCRNIPYLKTWPGDPSRLSAAIAYLNTCGSPTPSPPSDQLRLLLPIYPRDSKTNSDKGFVNIDNGSQGGTHWTCSIVKDNKSQYFDSFGVAPDKFLPNQLPKLIKYQDYKIQDINSRLCGSYCLYFFYLIERKDYYDTISKMFFDSTHV